MTFKQRLAAIVGPGNVLTSPEDTRPFFGDWRKQYFAPAECVVRPGTTSEVAEVVRVCLAEDVAIVPQGGNTGLCGGSVPTGTRREIVLSLSRLNRVREVDALNDTITVEAGCVLAAVQQTAADAGRFFPLSLAAEGTCQIGGNLSTNAGGINVLRYGTAREQVLGIEVVLPDGRIWNGLRSLRKDNTGYDLKQLFIGAEGTLGLICAATLRLHPKPTASVTAWMALDSPAAAVSLLAFLKERLGGRISAFELISRNCVEAVLEHRPACQDPFAQPHAWYVLAQLADSADQRALLDQVEGALFDGVQAGLLIDAVLAQSEEQARALWRLREAIPEAQFFNVKHDISVPMSKAPAFLEMAGAALEAWRPGVPRYAFGHVGDGNLHYNVGSQALMDDAPIINRIVYDAVDALGGSISAEHGLGQLKRDEIRSRKDAVEMALMAALKKTLDPRGIMNPGKVI